MTITYIIIGITVVISFIAYSNQGFQQKLIMNPYQVNRKQEYYRFITSGFIHADHMHLFFNMFSLYFFGRTMEYIFNMLFGAAGGFYFLALYLLGIIVSDIPTYMKNRNHPQYNSLGASGGVSAVIFASIIFLPLQDICLYFICLPGVIMGTAYIIFSWYQGRKANDNINHDAHLYGALFGLFFCLIVYPDSFPNFIEQIKNWQQYR
ncbi:MAG TPA: rhomboid family intramembrane serine protease [Ohtaekwangia sp.]|uniref:rhomboid family intramembrane serine protease n=1 Tax=Ohtaekwangia sp. TaxID=2066019 RepID=UPI002F92931B